MKTATRRIALSFLLILGVVFVCSVSLHQLLSRHCLLWTCAPTRSFGVHDLELSMSLFPEEATVTPFRRPTDLQGAVDSAIMTVFWEEGNGLAVYNVWQYGTENQASGLYQAQLRDSDYAEQYNLFFVSSVADEYSKGCGFSEFGGYRCDVKARYGEFVLSFNATIDEHLPVERFEELVASMDKQMAERLSFE